MFGMMIANILKGIIILISMEDTKPSIDQKCQYVLPFNPEFYSSFISLKYEHPTMIITHTKEIFTKRIKRYKKYLKQQGSSHDSNSSLNTLKSLSSHYLQDPIQPKAEPDQQRTYSPDDQYYNIYESPCTQPLSPQPLSSQSLPNPSCILDFHQLDQQRIVREYEELMKKHQNLKYKKQSKYAKNINPKINHQFKQSSIVITPINQNKLKSKFKPQLPKYQHVSQQDRLKETAVYNQSQGLSQGGIKSHADKYPKNRERQSIRDYLKSPIHQKGNHEDKLSPLYEQTFNHKISEDNFLQEVKVGCTSPRNKLATNDNAKKIDQRKQLDQKKQMEGAGKHGVEAGKKYAQFNQGAGKKYGYLPQGTGRKYGQHTEGVARQYVPHIELGKQYVNIIQGTKPTQSARPPTQSTLRVQEIENEQKKKKIRERASALLQRVKSENNIYKNM